MASQRRSVWEVRFFVLKERLIQKSQHIQLKAGNLALNESICQRDIDNLRNRKEVVDNLISDANRIETMSVNQVFLGKDY